MDFEGASLFKWSPFLSVETAIEACVPVVDEGLVDLDPSAVTGCVIVVTIGLVVIVLFSVSCCVVGTFVVIGPVVEAGVVVIIFVGVAVGVGIDVSVFVVSLTLDDEV